MSYAETLEYLYRSQPAFHLVGAAAYKPGLDNTIALMDHLGHPYRSFRSVHIAGTNGKGSTSHLIAATLQAAGLKTGLYTSPHLIDFRERIRINGAMIPESRVVEFVETNRDFLDTVKPSFFETTMALAFQYFAEEKVDIAVVDRQDSFGESGYHQTRSTLRHRRDGSGDDAGLSGDGARMRHLGRGT